MKINLNKSTKRALSLVLALAVAIGSLFTANIGINISADAATLNIKYWSGETTAPKANSDGSYTINTPEELAYIVGNGDKYEIGTNFKVADGIDAFIMQPSSIIVDSDNNGVLDIMECNNYTETKTFFDKLSGEIPWVTGNSSKPFRSNFNGNGVEIYGLYSASNTYAALFPYVGGAYAYEMTDNWSVGSVFENFAVRNSCLTGQRVGAIIAYETTPNDKVCNIQDCGSYNKSADDHSAYKGRITIQKCEITNCYIESTCTAAANSSENVGVMIGAYAWGDVAYGHHITDCIVYGNYAFNTNNGTKIQRGLFGGISGAVSNSNVYKEKYPGYCQYSNIITIDAAPGMVGGSSGYNCCSAELYSKVYTNVTKSPSSASDKTSWSYAIDYNSSQVTILESADAAKGSLGKLAMDLDWATDEEDGTWYAIDGEYPTLFKPEGWKDCETITPWDGTAAESFAADAEGNYGDGTAKKPYLIETPEQLFAMVKTGGKRTTAYTYTNANGEEVTLDAGAPAYYKVKDGVENLYLSKAISGGYAAAKACTDYHNWNTDTWTVFEGNFDGNGVTIRGMISKSTNNNKYVGLVHVFGEKAVVKNVNFDTCYAHNSSTAYAALLASQVIHMANEDADSEQTTETGGGKDGYNLVYNVSVRNSSIQSKGNSQCAGIVASYNGNPDMLQFVNCLYDGYSCELGNGETGTNANAGFAAYNWGINNAQFSGCVSLGAPIASNRTTDTAYNDYRTDKDGAQYTSSSGAKSYVCHPVYVFNCYTDIKETTNTTAVELVDENGASVITDDYDYINNMPLLDWANGWYVATDANGRKVPMPRVRTAADVPATWDTGEVVLNYNILLNGQFNGIGATAGSGPYDNGTFGFFYDFKGSGTADDPYLITTDLELARAIGSGGININQKLYFKLACDIDLNGMPWIDTVGCMLRNGVFTYVPFEGVLDGDGYTVTGLYAVSNDGAAGLIPELTSTGIVKNLHIRNSHIGTSSQYQPYKWVTDEFGTATEIDAENSVTNTNSAGAIAGKTAAGAQIIGCSVEDTTVVNTADGITADGNATVKNSYIDETYYNADGNEVTPDKIVLGSGIWYKGGLEGSMPQLVNRAAAMTETDVSGLGDADYNAADLSSLRNKLLRKSAYKYIYGDVNRDGNINSTDLVILRRAMVNDYKDLQDGFWRNVELGNVKIYYGENDNYDAARKLELYFESLYPGLDIQKIVSTSKETTSGTDSDSTKVYLHEGTGTGDPNGTDDGYFDIIVGDVKGKTTTCTGNNYAITYENNTLWLHGANFTAVEQAVLDYVEKTVPNTQEGGYTVESATLNPDKVPVTVGGTTYYYAWGDEFSGVNEDKTGLNFDNWLSHSQQSESQTGKSYMNQEVGTVKSLEKLLVVENGKLSMKRGHDSTLGTSNNGSVALIEGEDYSVGGRNGYTTLGENDQYFSSGKIHTDSSMLFKQGYIEMKASVPADGHAFPAWWMMANPTSNTHRNDGWTQSLYSKIYKINNNWNKTNTIDQRNLNTYKYQIPSAYYEVDIFEVMQTPSHINQFTSGSYLNRNYKTHNTAVGWYEMNGNIHKWYNNGTYKNSTPDNVADDTLYIADWDNYGFKAQKIDYTTFSGTSGWTHRFKATEHDFGNEYTSYSGSYTACNPTTTKNTEARRKLQYERKYGFLWKATDTTFECTLYIYDVNGDGDESDVVTLPITSNDDVVTNDWEDGGWLKPDTQVTEDESIYGDSVYNSKLMNSYMYLILDNKFYSYNNSGDGVGYTDLVTNAVSDASTSFDIDYMRVYQLNDHRDIVTPETENFNNNNHFGY